MGETPCFMMMGREVTLPIDLVFGKHTDQEPKSLPDYVEDFINRIEKVHEVVMILDLLLGPSCIWYKTFDKTPVTVNGPHHFI
jgi:hypothetical protein